MGEPARIELVTVAGDIRGDLTNISVREAGVIVQENVDRAAARPGDSGIQRRIVRDQSGPAYIDADWRGQVYRIEAKRTHRLTGPGRSHRYSHSGKIHPGPPADGARAK